VHAIQNARKGAGLQVEDRIALELGGDDELLGAARTHEAYVTGETLATSVAYDAPEGDAATIDGRPLTIAVRQVPRSG
jgi:isoleucyl-tRNA synthetase